MAWGSGAGQAIRQAAANRASGNGGTRAPQGKPKPGPVQRYLNKASGKMETAQAMHNYRAPSPTQRTATQRTAQRTTTTTTTQSAPTLIQMTPAQIEARAKNIVASEVAAERLPYQQRAAQIPREEQAAQGTHAQAYQQLDTSIGAQQTQQAGSAKTAQNEAADQLKKAEGVTPGVTQDIEHLGGAPAPGSALAQQEAAGKTLLTAIAAGAQSGTNARQQSESNFLTNIRTTAGQQGAAGTRAIQGEYAKQQADNTNKEAQVTATKPGRVGRLATSMFGEQEKDRIAAQSLGVKTATAESTIKKNATGEKLATKKAGLEGAKFNLAKKKNKADEEYKRATAGEKRVKDKLDTKKKELEIKKELEGNPHKGDLTPLQVNALSGEASKAFSVYRSAIENGASPAQAREALTRGYFRREVSPQAAKKLEAEGKKVPKPYNEKTGVALKQPIWLDVAEQIMSKGYIGAQTKQELREMKLPDSEWSKHFYRSTGGKRPAPPSNNEIAATYGIPKGK